RHQGSIVAVEPDGRIVARLGDESMTVSTRSCIKPIQAIPLVTSGAADRFNISSRELAVVCASHEGEPIHTDTVARILARIGLSESALLCGAHRPYSEETAVRIEREGRHFTQLHNNCSGKHSGMLATAVHTSTALEDYVSPDHPVQRNIQSLLCRIAGLTRSIPVATDGCSAPTFGVPLASLALAFSRLINPWTAGETKTQDPAGTPESVLGGDESLAAKWIVAAMTAHPEMVGGTRGRLDTDLMRAAKGKLISKIGAEAVHAVGVLPSARFPRGLGLAVKIQDGSKRALHSVVVEALKQLGVLEDDELAFLESYHHPELTNHRKIVVGEIRPVFELAYSKRTV
ncbi:MAG: asparaginase, partial [Blastocatellia bacterium]